jgi:hypothetical protein
MTSEIEPTGYVGVRSNPRPYRDRSTPGRELGVWAAAIDCRIDSCIAIETPAELGAA